jgi:hypothetical protein
MSLMNNPFGFIVIASEARQSRMAALGTLDCFAALAMTARSQNL